MWEKTKLKDFFRIYYKVFTFCGETGRYFIPPITTFDEWALYQNNLDEASFEHFGYSRTGATVN